MPCKKKYVRIRSVDVGRPGHHYIRVGVRRAKGKRGGRTEIIGGLREYKSESRDTVRRDNWTQTSKTKTASVFVNDEGWIVYALKQGRTVGGLQVWRLEIYRGKGKEEKTVWLKKRSELREALKHI